MHTRLDDTQSDVCTNNEIMNELDQSDIEFDATSCSLSTGAKGAIAATVLWLVAAISIVATHPRHTKSKRSDIPDDQSESRDHL